MMISEGGSENDGSILAVSESNFNFGRIYGTIPSFQRCFPNFSVKFNAGDIRTQSSH